MTDKERLAMMTQTAKNRRTRIKELEKEIDRLKAIILRDSIDLAEGNPIGLNT